MCGIAGIYSRREQGAHMHSMLEIMAHRGPDNRTVWQSNNMTLGHLRLSIIDLSTGDQPIFTPDKRYAIVYNGELYNYKKLRDELRAEGVVFHTDSDTEVLLQAYVRWGTSVFARLNGIFAFCIYDTKEESFVLARDHFGIKPLHYYQTVAGDLLFASEQKAILCHPSVERSINYQSLHYHLNLRYSPVNETLFAGIKRLPPASFLTYKRGEVKIEKYFQLKPDFNKKMSRQEAIEGIHKHLKTAVERQLVSDVPVGVYLSGGLDSSSIVQKMSELGVDDIRTFTLGFNEPTDEFPEAKCIAETFQTKHHELSLSMNPMEEFPQVIWHAEEPKINLLQGYNMSRFVQPHVKVVLGGLGGDELFAGYDIHRLLNPLQQYKKAIPSFLNPLLRLKSKTIFKLQHGHMSLASDEYRRGIQALLAINEIEKAYLIVRNVWDGDDGAYGDIYQPEMAERMRQGKRVLEAFQDTFSRVGNEKYLNQILYAEWHHKMVNDYLLVEDRMSMAHSVEERVPFLDLDLVRFAFQIPVDYKLKGKETKHLFREAMRPYLPEMITSKKKWGFTVNPYLQFKKDLKTTAERILTPTFVKNQGIFNYDYIQRILKAKPSPKMRWHYNYLWIAMGIAIWQKMYVDTSLFSQKKTFHLEDFYD